MSWIVPCVVQWISTRRETIGSNMGSTMDCAVGSVMVSSVDSAVGSVMDSVMGSTIGSTVGRSMSSSVGISIVTVELALQGGNSVKINWRESVVEISSIGKSNRERH